MDRINIVLNIAANIPSHCNLTLVALSCMCSHSCPGGDWRKCGSLSAAMAPPTTTNIHSHPLAQGQAWIERDLNRQPALPPEQHSPTANKVTIQFYWKNKKQKRTQRNLLKIDMSNNPPKKPSPIQNVFILSTFIQTLTFPPLNTAELLLMKPQSDLERRNLPYNFNRFERGM